MLFWCAYVCVGLFLSILFVIMITEAYDKHITVQNVTDVSNHSSDGKTLAHSQTDSTQLAPLWQQHYQTIINI